MRIIAKKEGKKSSWAKIVHAEGCCSVFRIQGTSITAGVGHEGVREGHKIDKLFLPIKKKEKWGFSRQFLHKQPIEGKISAQCCLFGDTSSQ